jgi:5-methylcytosine-specific restriction endonuclease McrA
VCYQLKSAKTRRYAGPVLLRPMLLKYFYNSPMSGHLGSFKTWKKVGHQFDWPKLREDVFHYVHQCKLCQRAKPTQDTKVGLHMATPASYPLESFY